MLPLLVLVGEILESFTTNKNNFQKRKRKEKNILD